jgi:hypothetical protein
MIAALDELKKLFSSNELLAVAVDRDEFERLTEEIEDSVINLKDEVSKLKTEISELESLSLDEPSHGWSVDLGLDKMHYSFEKGNLKIIQQFENWVALIKKQNCAGVVMPNEIF